MPELSEGPISVALVPPCGLDEICATFGDIFGYIATDHTLDPRWHTEFLDRIALPFPMPLSWDRRQTLRVCSSAFKAVGYRVKSPASADASRFVPNALGRSFLLTPGESRSI